MRVESLLCFDLATTTGWSWLRKDGVIEHGVESFKPTRGESQGMRYMKFRHWLEGMLEMVKPDLVIYERPMGLRGTAAQEILWGFVTRVLEECERRKIEYSDVPATVLKKWATGKGNAGKPKMVARAKELFPNESIVDHNDADALLILVWAKEKHLNQRL